jgi:hypothetical protein
MTHTTTELPPPLTNKQLTGFDRRRIALIREMEAHGWRGRRGSRQHMIMRAPDGLTTTAISKKVISSNDEFNVARDFRAWLRRQQDNPPEITVALIATADEDPGWIEGKHEGWTEGKPIATGAVIRKKRKPRAEPIAEPVAEVVTSTDEVSPEPDPEPVDTAVLPVAQRATEFTCGLCERDFGGPQPLSVHRFRAHIKVCCEVCDQPMSPSGLPRHMRKHTDDIGTHEQAMREVVQLRAQVARLRDESAEWQSLAETCESEYAELTEGMRRLLEG